MGVPAQEGVPAWGVCTGQGAGGCTCWGGCTCPGDVPAWGVPAQVPHPPVNRMTDRCKNITLPQTSFAGGNDFVGENRERIPSGEKYISVC